jgi:hypothetical protein
LGNAGKAPNSEFAWAERRSSGLSYVGYYTPLHPAPARVTGPGQGRGEAAGVEVCETSVKRCLEVRHEVFLADVTRLAGGAVHRG